MSNASAAAIVFFSGAPFWVVILVALFTNEHTTKLLALWSEAVIDVLVALCGEGLTMRVALLREARRTR
ncbi:hypothetical protein [Frigoribacterium sp. VKM Ac-2836]|uniref:hypothetical protein n=1 Tax=Frigoribacterium sp. VKM Ac-2836 TaxID=2739014 RepID=UPI0015646EBE|nr:hypothetical protein [Frigoribacterium sp. VKM Ac-2836]NRD26494.1 hypothetical protein [Frigoribacterium sp. VKM Ac-2836]